MALPSNDKIPGDLGHTDDHNLIVSDIQDVRNTFLAASVASFTYLRQDSASATYSTIDSPSFTGIPTAPTASAGTDTTQIATTEFVSTAIGLLIDSAPTVLDTLNELAAAIGDDPNFITSIGASVSLKLDSSVASATYLTQVAASGLYIPISASFEYLTTYNASATYLTQFAASALYLNIQDATDTYLSQIAASALYLNIQDAIDTYLSQQAASALYLNIQDAADTYFPISSSVSNFGTIVTDTETVVADLITDTLTLSASNGVVINGTASADTIDFSTNATNLDDPSTIVLRDENQSFDISRIDFNVSASVNGISAGQLMWNNEEGTLDLGMNNNVIQSIGMEFYMPPTKNDSGEDIPNGSFVMATGAQGDRITIAKAVTTGSFSPEFMIGVATETILNGSETGLITTNGIVRDINTASYTVGTILYPDPEVAGGLTSEKPVAPNIRTPIAIVLRQQENTGRIYVRMTNGSKFGETDSNVRFDSITNRDVAVYNAASSVWINEQILDLVKEVDGSGSGIDADLLDGEEGSYYLNTSSTAQTKTGDLTITGNFTVNGTTTTINSTTLSVDDKNIELGSVDTPTDTTADGGGITLKGATDKTFNWIDSIDAWTSSENLDLASGKGYYIDGVNVLSSTALGSGITSSSLTSVGTITSGVWQGSEISTTYTTAKVTSVNGSTGAITGLAITAGKLSQFAATTSAELAGVINDETGSGALVFATSPSLTTPNIGSASGASLSLTGSLTAASKSFDIEHPTKEGMRLRYGSLEGEEHGVYIRGKSNSFTITLPDYWTGLVDEDSITVQVTPIGRHKNLYVKDISNNTVTIGGCRGEFEFFYFIQAERKDIDKLVVEYGG